jgi:hypothetical protein
MIGIEPYFCETTMLMYADLSAEELQALREAPTLYDEALAWLKQSIGRLFGTPAPEQRTA